MSVALVTSLNGVKTGHHVRSTQRDSHPNPDRWRRGRLLGGICYWWAEAHPEEAGIPYDISLISLVVNIAAIPY